MTTPPQPQMSLASIVRHLSSLAYAGGGLPDPSTDEGREVRQFLANTWREARDGLLARTNRIRVRPLPMEGPQSLEFEIDRPYKRKRANGMVDLDPGPLRGTITYRASVLRPEPGSRSIVVFVSSEGFFHPNHNRAHGVLCPGDLPPGPFPLDALLEHIYSIVSYQNLDSTIPLDREAARYFATDPNAFEGLADVQPLY